MEKAMDGKSKITLSNKIFFGWVEEEVAAGRSVRFSVKGYSMMPLLRSEVDEVDLEPLDFNNCGSSKGCGSKSIKVGDILLFRYLGQHILHRVIDVKSYCPEFAASIFKSGQNATEPECGCNWYVLRGDNVIGRKEVAPSCDVIGRVGRVYRKDKNGAFREILPISAGYRCRLLFWRMLIRARMAIGSLLRSFRSR